MSEKKEAARAAGAAKTAKATETAAEAAKATEAAMEAAEAAKAAEAVTYVGPDIKKVAINGTTYIGGLPDVLQEKIEQIPAIRGLLVPISKLAETGVAIATKGTALNNLYESVQVKLRELED